MKLRLDEYYSIINEEWEDIESYMPEDMAEEFEKFRESHIEVINSRYNINYIDLEKSYINYTAIIKIKDKYYSFDWYYTWYWTFKDQVDADADLTEVIPKEVTITKYEVE